MSVTECGELALEPLLPTEYFALWRCIACGATGNFKPCMGTCDYRKLELVRSVEFAELFDEASAVMEQVKRLTAFVQQIADIPQEGSERANSYRILQNCARDLLRGLGTLQDEPASAAERVLVWLCHSCAQIEAPQQCLGVCIRPTEEFVRAKHHDGLTESLMVASAQAQKLRALVRRLAWVSPRPGQCEYTLQAFQDEARAILKAP